MRFNHQEKKKEIWEIIRKIWETYLFYYYDDLLSIRKKVEINDNTYGSSFETYIK